MSGYLFFLIRTVPTGQSKQCTTTQRGSDPLTLSVQKKRVKTGKVESYLLCALTDTSTSMETPPVCYEITVTPLKTDVGKQSSALEGNHTPIPAKAAYLALQVFGAWKSTSQHSWFLQEVEAFPQLHVLVWRSWSSRPHRTAGGRTAGGTVTRRRFCAAGRDGSQGQKEGCNVQQKEGCCRKPFPEQHTKNYTPVKKQQNALFSSPRKGARLPEDQVEKTKLSDPQRSHTGADSFYRDLAQQKHSS